MVAHREFTRERKIMKLLKKALWIRSDLLANQSHHHHEISLIGEWIGLASRDCKSEEISSCIKWIHLSSIETNDFNKSSIIESRVFICTSYRVQYSRESDEFKLIYYRANRFIWKLKSSFEIYFIICKCGIAEIITLVGEGEGKWDDNKTNLIVNGLVISFAGMANRRLNDAFELKLHFYLPSIWLAGILIKQSFPPVDVKNEKKVFSYEAESFLSAFSREVAGKIR